MRVKIPVSGAAARPARWYGAAMARRVVTAVALAALALTGAGSAARQRPRAPGDALVITGHGWGHGVGMSQWGAYGYALHGWDATRILAHYYPGTTLGRTPPPRSRVLLTDGASSVTVGSTAPWRLVDATGAELEAPGGDLTLPAVVEGARRPRTARARASSRPSRFARRGAARAGRPRLPRHAHGRLRRQGAPGRQRRVARGLPPRRGRRGGVVGVAAGRSRGAGDRRAVVRARAARADDPGSPFDLYSDGRDQVYGGIAAESPAISAAVAATARPRRPLPRRASRRRTSPPAPAARRPPPLTRCGIDIPYLVSVPDPWDTYAPYHDWGPVVLTPRLAAKELGLHGPLVNFEVESAPDGRVVSATLATARRTLTLTGAQFRDALGLRSSWFQLRLGRPPERAADADGGMMPPSRAP